MRFLITLSTAALLSLPLAATTAMADGHGAQAMKERQSVMKGFGKNISVLGDMAKGAKPYDAAAATAAATALAELANGDTSAFWVAGTDTSVKGSRALPALFNNLDDVKKIEGDLATASTAMIAAAGNGLDALRAGLGPVGAACGACHKPYRQPK